MERYTIEDIEIIRRKSGISYEEAVNLLEYHNGNLAKALVDLERNGRIKPESQQKACDAPKNSEAKQKACHIFTRLYRARVMVKKSDVVILNLSMLFSALALLISPHLVIIGLILILVLGYRISFVKNSKDFSGDNIENMVRNAASNVKQTVTSFAKDIGASTDEKAKGGAAQPMEGGRSFYQAGPQAAAPADQTPPARPESTRPVSVNCPQDGDIQVKEENDGYTEATIR